MSEGVLEVGSGCSHPTREQGIILGPTKGNPGADSTQAPHHAGLAGIGPLTIASNRLQPDH